MKKIVINEQLISKYVNREGIQKMKITSIMFALFLLGMFIFSYSYRVHGIIMPPLAMMFLFILLIIYIMSLSQIEDQIRFSYFSITEEAISKFLDKEKLNLVNQIGIARIESKYGANFNQKIYFDEIFDTIISENEIRITSNHYNFFTNNGRIVIPKEVNDFETIKQYVIENAEKFKLYQEKE